VFVYGYAGRTEQLYAAGVLDGSVEFLDAEAESVAGGVILSPPANSDFNFANHPVLYTDLLSSSVPYISAAGGVFPQVFALHCQPTAGSGGYVWPVCLGSYYPQTQMRLMAGLPQGGSGTLQNVKGVLK